MLKVPQQNNSDQNKPVEDVQPLPEDQSDVEMQIDSVEFMQGDTYHSNAVVQIQTLSDVQLTNQELQQNIQTKIEEKVSNYFTNGLPVQTLTKSNETIYYQLNPSNYNDRKLANFAVNFLATNDIKISEDSMIDSMSNSLIELANNHVFDALNNTNRGMNNLGVQPPENNDTNEIISKIVSNIGTVAKEVSLTNGGMEYNDLSEKLEIAINNQTKETLPDTKEIFKAMGMGKPKKMSTKSMSESELSALGQQIADNLKTGDVLYSDVSPMTGTFLTGHTGVFNKSKYKTYNNLDRPCILSILGSSKSDTNTIVKYYRLRSHLPQANGNFQNGMALHVKTNNGANGQSATDEFYNSYQGYHYWVHMIKSHTDQISKGVYCSQIPWLIWRNYASPATDLDGGSFISSIFHVYTRVIPIVMTVHIFWWTISFVVYIVILIIMIYLIDIVYPIDVVNSANTEKKLGWGSFE